MDIATYLKTADLTQEEFARRVGVSQGAVSQWLLGKIKPSPRRALDIERASEGAISRHELCPEVFGAAA